MARDQFIVWGLNSGNRLYILKHIANRLIRVAELRKIENSVGIMKFDNHYEVNDILLLNFLYKNNQKIKNQILFKIKMYKWYKKVRFFFKS